MPLAIHNLKPSAKSTKKRKRIGRGNASGTGTYSGRGLKGQKSRSGVSNLKRLGMKQVLLRTPKKRGFKSLKPDNQVLNLSALNEAYKKDEKITVKDLYKKGLIASFSKNVKILGNGKLTVSGLHISGIAVSESAKEQIEKHGGKIA